MKRHKLAAAVLFVIVQYIMNAIIVVRDDYVKVALLAWVFPWETP